MQSKEETKKLYRGCIHSCTKCEPNVTILWKIPWCTYTTQLLTSFFGSFSHPICGLATRFRKKFSKNGEIDTVSFYACSQFWDQETKCQTDKIRGPWCRNPFPVVLKGLFVSHVAMLPIFDPLKGTLCCSICRYFCEFLTDSKKQNCSREQRDWVVQVPDVEQNPHQRPNHDQIRTEEITRVVVEHGVVQNNPQQNTQSQNSCTSNNHMYVSEQNLCSMHKQVLLTLWPELTEHDGTGGVLFHVRVTVNEGGAAVQQSRHGGPRRVRSYSCSFDTVKSMWDIANMWNSMPFCSMSEVRFKTISCRLEGVFAQRTSEWIRPLPLWMKITTKRISFCIPCVLMVHARLSR